MRKTVDSLQRKGKSKKNGFFWLHVESTVNMFQSKCYVTSLSLIHHSPSAHSGQSPKNARKFCLPQLQSLSLGTWEIRIRWAQSRKSTNETENNFISSTKCQHVSAYRVVYSLMTIFRLCVRNVLQLSSMCLVTCKAAEAAAHTKYQTSISLSLNISSGRCSFGIFCIPRNNNDFQFSIRSKIAGGRSFAAPSRNVKY